MKDSIKQRITEVARNFLFNHREEEITMSHIAKELNITVPTLYHYFESKDELLLAGNKLIESEISAHLKLKFPKSIPYEMRIITATTIVAEYFMKNNLPAHYLTENPKDRPIRLSGFRKEFIDMFRGFVKGQKRVKISAEQLAYRYLSLVQADIIYYRSKKKDLPNDFAERIFSII